MNTALRLLVNSTHSTKTLLSLLVQSSTLTFFRLEKLVKVRFEIVSRNQFSVDSVAVERIL